ncbi:MAG: sensor histidine kinase, partial [Omnitrophica WOR_2 bacterium]
QDCRELIYCTPAFVENCLNVARQSLHRESTEVLLPDGRWLDITVDPMLDEANQLSGFVHILTEITERKQVEDQLRFQANVLENINDAVIVTDLSFRITSWNKGAEHTYGWKAEEVIGKPAKEVLRSEISSEQRAAIYTGLSEGVPAVTELVQYTREDRKLIISGYTLPLKNAQGEIAGYVAVNQDITERKRAETGLKTYAAQLERSNRDLQDFAYIASHDLQEPLRKVRLFGERLKASTGPGLDEKGLDYINRMQNAAERMQKMIEDLLSYSRVTTRAQPHRKVDLSQVVAEVLSDLDIRIEQTHGQIEVGSLPVIEAEPLQMRQLFQNLIGNALKFHKRDAPPVVRVQSKTLPGNRVEITVEDNGIGIAKENIDMLFQLFRRLHGRSEYEGNGIGLSICRRIVERHNGTISARSEPGKGSTFIIILPV